MSVEAGTEQTWSRQAWSSIATLFLSNEQHDRFHSVCTEVGLPHPGALKLLLRLGDSEVPTMGDVARLLSCDASYVTTLVDSIETLGLAERRVAPEDRRVKTIHLTDAGVRARTRAYELLTEPPPRMARLTGDETRTLARLLTKLTAD